jgi:hypothetical protein
MKIKVVAMQKLGNRTNVFYLNSMEPKSQQLYMAVLLDLSIEILTVYNQNTDQYEDVTALFQPTFLNNLSQHISNQLIHYNQAKAL